MCATIFCICLTPQSLAEHMWCFFYLLKITTIVIIKANAIIVIPTNPQKSKYIIIT